MTFGNFDDEQARQVLRSVSDGPAPPATTSAADVIRRGRRRVLVQRAGAIAGVVVVVAAIGVTSIWLGSSATDGGSGVRVGEAPTSATTTTGLPADWTRVESPPPAGETSTTTVTVPPQGGPTDPESGQPETDETAVQPQYCTPSILEVPAGDATILPESAVEPVFTKAVASQLGDTPTVTTSQWEALSQRTGTARGYVEVTVPGPAGDGSVQLEVVPFVGDPLDAADLDLYAYGGDCVAPLRLVQEDGSVLQLYEPDTLRPEQPAQYLRVYQPDGRLYIVTTAGWSSENVENGVVVGGTGELPLTVEQLADVGVRLATLR